MAFLQRNTTIFSGTISSPTVTKNMVLNKPSGTVEGDMMVAWVCGDSSIRRNITPPSGWSVIYNQSSPDLGGSAQQFGYYKVATASEPSTYTFVWSGSGTRYKGVLTSYYDTNGTGTWTVSSLGGGNLVNSTGITSLSITGAGLYVTAFLSDDADTPDGDNSPVPEIARSVADSLGFITYGGDYTATNHTITQDWTSYNDDKYANNVIFAHQVSGDYVSKIRVGSAYKNILDGWVAVDEGLFPGSATSWKKITEGHIKVGDGQKGTWKEIFKSQ